MNPAKLEAESAIKPHHKISEPALRADQVRRRIKAEEKRQSVEVAKPKKQAGAWSDKPGPDQRRP